MSTAAVVGGGPAGLIAAEILSANGVAVTVYDRMPSVGRKFLMAGRGGLNLTHSEDLERFIERYREAAPVLRSLLEAFPPSALIAWAQGLGQQTFTGSSGRIFPKAMKASPLLRAWLARLAEQGVQFRLRCDWQGWDGAALVFDANGTRTTVKTDAVILALGGVSWPKLGSDGTWTKVLEEQGTGVHSLKPANVGFNIAWSDVFKERFAGQPIKNALFKFGGREARGEAMVTAYGIEGGAIYALSAPLRDAVLKDGSAELRIDLRPDLSEVQIANSLDRPRGKDSLTNFLRKVTKLAPLEINLLREAGGLELKTLPRDLKDVHLKLTGVQPIARAISTAGGVAFASLDENLMLKSKPGVFVAGEMLDWEAPTGGYLLQATFATGIAAAKGALGWIK